MMQQQEELLRPSAAFITAAAQPTPALTSMASVGQLREQAPHSMHESRLSIRTLPFSLASTACGQT
jgi:hypothetical protein